MPRGKRGYTRSDAKSKRDQEEKQQKKELAEAEKNGLIDSFTSEPVSRAPATKSPKKSTGNNANWVQESKRKWYVLDTNLILNCVDVIYDATDENWREPIDFRPNLDNAHLIIPEKVFDELNHIKDGYTVKRSVAQKALRRLTNFFPNSERSLKDIMTLAQPVRTGWKHQVISICKLHRNFRNSLPWVPDEKDNDGWIAVTALAATMIRDGLPVDGSVSIDEVLERSNTRRDVVLLTNDKGLLSKADGYAVRAHEYSFQPRPPFTGLRELTVPSEMLEKFFYEGELTREEFEGYMPKEAPLVANEYIVMNPEGDAYPRSYFTTGGEFANIARYHKAEQVLRPMRYVKREGDVPPNAGIATYCDAMNDNDIKVIVATGKAGTGKTYQIIRHAIKALREGRYAMVVLIIDPDTGIGYLKGDQEKKLEPMVAFCKDAIRSYLASTPEFKKKREALRKFGDMPDGYVTDGEKQANANGKTKRRRKKPAKNFDTELTTEGYYDYMYEGGIEKITKPASTTNNANNSSGGTNGRNSSQKTYYELLEEQVDYIYKRYFMAIPYKQAQGRTFEDAIIVVDEAQRIFIDEMETFITRLGKNSLLVTCGDVNQIHYNSAEKRIKNGLIFTRRIYYDWDGCANIHLTDNMRHEAADIANKNYEKVIEEIGELQT